MLAVGAGLLSAKRAALTVTAVAVMLAVMTAGAAQDSDVRDEALALSLGAVDAYESGDMEEAERLYRESLPLYEELGDDNGLAMTYHGLGLSYELRGEIGEARLWFLRSLELNELRG
ncbi:MAG: tetratricopeptide repeat protein, partial [Alphaproteobacteria bacterium]|nr:tetratricopeptide repeat protein [Alphaproteobacteria bacterium]